MVSLNIIRSVLLLLPNKYNVSWLIRCGVLFLVIVNANVLAEISWLSFQDLMFFLLSLYQKNADNESINMVLSSNKNRPAITNVDLFGVIKTNLYKDSVSTAGENRLNVTVVGVVYSDINENNILIIEINGKQVSYTIGDAIFGTNAIIRKIEPQQIIIERAGRFESLNFKQEKNGADVMVRKATDVQNDKIQYVNQPHDYIVE